MGIINAIWGTIGEGWDKVLDVVGLGDIPKPPERSKSKSTFGSKSRAKGKPVDTEKKPDKPKNNRRRAQHNGRKRNPNPDGKIRQENTMPLEEALSMTPEETDVDILQWHKETLLAPGKRKAYGVLMMERAADMGFDEAVKRIENDPEVQCALGKIYESGDYSKAKDLQKAIEFYSKAADRDFPEAQYLLGLKLYDGDGIGQNQYRAVRLWERAADHLSVANKKLGEPEVCRILGESYAKEKNWMLALRWWEKSREAGSTEAPYHIGLMYKDGIYVDKNPEKALQYFKISSEREYLPAMYEYGRVLLDPDYGDYLPEEGAVLLKKAADRGNSDAEQALQESAVMYWLGCAYEKGSMGFGKNDDKAFEWMKKAAEADNTAAQFRLGCFYLKGTGVLEDSYRGIYWIKVAEETGSDEAKSFLEEPEKRFLLAIGNLEGKAPFSRNVRQGEALLEQLSGQAYPPAQVWLGKSLLQHEGDRAFKGVRLLLQAKESSEAEELLKSPRGQAVLGEMYLKGNPPDIEKDEGLAQKYLKKAANLGDARGQFQYGLFLYEKGVHQESRNDLHWAVSYWDKAAGQGWQQAKEKLYEAENQFDLGEAYQLGRGGQQRNGKKAFEWYQKAADQQLAKAQYALADMYYQGESVRQDIEKAADLWIKACRQDKRYLNKFAETGILERLGGELLERKKYEAALPWLEMLVDQNDAKAMYDYGWILDEGKTGNRNQFQAVLFWEKSARLKYQKAQKALENPEILYRLGIAYHQGKSNARKDDEKAKAYLEKAEGMGHQKAKEYRKEHFPKFFFL